MNSKNTKTPLRDPLIIVYFRRAKGEGRKGIPRNLQKKTFFPLHLLTVGWQGPQKKYRFSLLWFSEMLSRLVRSCLWLRMSEVVKSRIYCAVAQCRNYGFKSAGVMYHRFPKNEELRRLWISRCKRSDKFNPDNSRVCSVHFLPGDYQRDLKNELLGLPSKKNLLPNAVPSQFIPNWHGEMFTEGPSTSTSETTPQVFIPYFHINCTIILNDALST